MAEWFKATVLKTVVLAIVPRVRISPSPPSVACYNIEVFTDEATRETVDLFVPSGDEEEYPSG